MKTLRTFVSSLVLLVAFAVSLSAQTTVTKSFSSVSNGLDIIVPNGWNLDYDVSGTFSATWVLQKSADAVQWETVTSSTTTGSGSIRVESGNAPTERYRFIVTARASGTVDTSLISVPGGKVLQDKGYGKALPALCVVGDVFFKTAAASSGLYQCTAPNTWTLAATGGAPASPVNSLQFNDGGAFGGADGALICDGTSADCAPESGGSPGALLTFDQTLTQIINKGIGTIPIDGETFALADAGWSSLASITELTQADGSPYYGPVYLSAGNNGAALWVSYAKTRSADGETPAIVQDNDEIGRWNFYADAGEGPGPDVVDASAYMLVAVDGTPVSMQTVPARFEWYASPGNANPELAMVLSATGYNRPFDPILRYPDPTPNATGLLVERSVTAFPASGMGSAYGEWASGASFFATSALLADDPSYGVLAGVVAQAKVPSTETHYISEMVGLYAGAVYEGTDMVGNPATTGVWGEAHGSNVGVYSLTGGYFTATAESITHTNDINGIQGQGRTAGNAAVQQVNGVHGINQFEGTGTVAQSIAIHAGNPDKDMAVTVTDNYGLYVSSMSSGSNNWAIKTNAGLVSFGDDVELANGKAIKPTTTTANTLLIQGYDNNTGPGYVTFCTITNGNSPSFACSPPAGGATLTISATSLTNAALTEGRVTFAGASGVLTDDSDLTFVTDKLGSATLKVRGSFYAADDTAGATATVSVRKGDDSGACDLVFKNGVYTSTTC